MFDRQSLNGLNVGTRVVVLEGRHFDTFVAGETGSVLSIDKETGTCKVSFDRDRRTPISVAIRHLGPESRQANLAGQRRGQDLPLQGALVEALEIPASFINKVPTSRDATIEAALDEAIQASAKAMSSASRSAFFEAASVRFDVDELRSLLEKETCERASSLEQLELSKEDLRRDMQHQFAELREEVQRRFAQVMPLVEAANFQKAEHQRLAQKQDDLLDLREALQERLQKADSRISRFEQRFEKFGSRLEEIASNIDRLRREVAGKADRDVLEDLKRAQVKTEKELLTILEHLEHRFAKLKEMRIAKLNDSMEDLEQGRRQLEAAAMRQTSPKSSRNFNHNSDLYRHHSSGTNSRAELTPKALEFGNVFSEATQAASASLGHVAGSIRSGGDASQHLPRNGAFVASRGTAEASTASRQLLSPVSEPVTLLEPPRPQRGARI
eukprot:TRINITY_DN98676_c0_g1_i1.p1 TRINITY_DN98676_c0_g1~~TRINITY_DN98676_c0_g1_i1.p1  ORF type:complete len:442 (-),score=100.26 TRINITY_DN98676_c0_g1_i1:32-1357(-)